MLANEENRKYYFSETDLLFGIHRQIDVQNQTSLLKISLKINPFSFLVESTLKKWEN